MSLLVAVTSGYLMARYAERVPVPTLTYPMLLGGVVVIVLSLIGLQSTPWLIFSIVLVFSGFLSFFPALRQVYASLRWIFIIILGGKGLLRVLTDQVDLSRIDYSGAVIVGGFCLYTFVSMIYSVNASLTLLRATSLALLFVGLYTVVIPEYRTWREVKELLSLVYKAGLAAVVPALLVLLVTGRVVFVGNRLGFADVNASNALALFLAINLPLAIVEYHRAERGMVRVLALVVCVFYLVLVLLTQSRAGLFSALAGLVITTWKLPRHRQRTLMMIVLGFALTSVLVTILVHGQITPEVYGRLTGQSIGLFESRARRDLWELALEYWRERPLLGYGFGATGYVWENTEIPGLEYQLGSGARSRVTNGYLDLAVQLGIVGVVWILSVLGQALLFGFRAEPREDGAISVAALLGIVVTGMANNIAEPWLTGVGGGVTITFWLAVVLLLRLRPIVNHKVKEGKPPIGPDDSEVR
jgi:O-antigen ligase